MSVDAVLWITRGRFFRNQVMPDPGRPRDDIVVPVSVLVGHQSDESVEISVDKDVIFARFRRVAPDSMHFALAKGPPPGWRWIVHDGELIAERV